MTELFLLASFVTLIMLIWFKSDAVIAWGSLFGLSKFLKIDEFYDKRLEMAIKGISFTLSYPEFLKEKYHHNFITKLLGCPLCLSVWLSILSCIFISVMSSSWLNLLFIPTVCVLSLTFYGLIISLNKLSS
jgi:uncharacterized membrane protein